MANEVQLYVGTYALDSTNKVAVEDIDIKVAKAIREYELPKFHGSIVPIGKRKSIVITIRGTIIDTNYDALRTGLDSLKNAIEGTAEKNFTLDDDRILKVQYRNFACKFRTIRTFADFSFDLIASDPFWYAASLTTVNQSWTTNVTHNVTNNGNAPTRVKVTVTAPGGSSIANDIIIENTTTGELFKYRGTLAASKALVVNNKMDATDLAVTNDGTSDIKNFDGDFITLAAGVNAIKMTCGTSTATLQYIYRDSYF